MPTENRSSNTEQMVSELLPCPFCKAAMHIESNRYWHRVMGEHDEECVFLDPETMMVPATDEQRELLVRDWNRRKKSAAQYQGEPVALPERKDTTQHWAEPGGVHKAEGWNAYHEELARLGPLYTHPAPFQQGEPVAFYREFVDGREYCEKPFTNDWTPLYTHAAAAGEVEQGYHNSVVEGLVSRQNELREERDTLRAEVDQFKLANARLSKENVDRRNQLAEREAALDALNEIATGYKRDLDERDALLRDINKRHSSGVDFDLPADLAARVAAVCATSAEPSAMGTDAGIPASVERDERAEFESWVETRKVCTHKCAKLHKDRAGSYLDYRINDRWLTWQARAALERKP